MSGFGLNCIYSVGKVQCCKHTSFTQNVESSAPVVRILISVYEHSHCSEQQDMLLTLFVVCSEWCFSHLGISLQLFSCCLYPAMARYNLNYHQTDSSVCWFFIHSFRLIFLSSQYDRPNTMSVIVTNVVEHHFFLTFQTGASSSPAPQEAEAIDQRWGVWCWHHEGRSHRARVRNRTFCSLCVWMSHHKLLSCQGKSSVYLAKVNDVLDDSAL